VYERPVDGGEQADLAALRVGGGLVVAPVRDGEGRDAAQQVGDGQTHEPWSGPRALVRPTSPGQAHEPGAGRPLDATRLMRQLIAVAMRR